MNVAYSLRLKHVVVVDVMIVAFGFVLRAFAGVAAINADTTGWFILCVFMLSLFLALAKRRSELELFKEETGKQRKVLKEYSLPMLDALLGIVVSMALICYSLFAMSAHASKEMLLADNVPMMIVTVPLAIYGMFRYLYLIYMKGLGGKPEEVLLKDKAIWGTCILYVLCIIFIRNL